MDAFRPAQEVHPDRVINVGIREQLLIGVGGGLALTGLRPVVHTFASFLVERPFEQVKLDFGHQGTGGVLVSASASYDWPSGGYTHMAPGDVALLDTLDGWTVHVPGHPDEAEALLRHAYAAGDDKVYVRLSAQENAAPRPVDGLRFQTVREGGAGVVVAVGPLLDNVLAATEGMDLTVLYATTVRPFDDAALRAAAGRSTGAAPMSSSWSRTSPGPPRPPRTTPSGRCPTGSWAWESAAPSCAATARSTSTPRRTAWTPARCAGGSPRSWGDRTRSRPPPAPRPRSVAGHQLGVGGGQPLRGRLEPGVRQDRAKLPASATAARRTLIQA